MGFISFSVVANVRAAFGFSPIEIAVKYYYLLTAISISPVLALVQRIPIVQRISLEKLGLAFPWLPDVFENYAVLCSPCFAVYISILSGESLIRGALFSPSIRVKIAKKLDCVYANFRVDRIWRWIIGKAGYAAETTLSAGVSISLCCSLYRAVARIQLPAGSCS